MLFNGLIEIFLSEIVLAYVIVSEAAIVVMKRMLLECDGFSELIQSLIVVLLLKVGQAEVVMSA